MATLANTSKSALEVVFGCLTFGEEGIEQARIHGTIKYKYFFFLLIFFTDIKTCQKVLDVFKSHGHNELDTARFYCGGTCEQYLGKMEVQSKQGFKLATKV